MVIVSRRHYDLLSHHTAALFMKPIDEEALLRELLEGRCQSKLA